MSVRLKISLLIAFAGFFSGVVFSSFMIRYVLHEYAESIDHDLKFFSTYAIEELINKKGSLSGFDNDKYWVEIYREKSGEAVFRSELADKVKIIVAGRTGSWNETVKVEADTPFVRSSSDHTAIFHIKAKQFIMDGVNYMVYSALPVEYLKGEAIELLTGLAGGLIFSIIFYFGGSYIITGFVLRPVRDINEMTRNITEKQLHLRLVFNEKGRDNDEFNNLAKTLNGLFDRLENAFNRQKRLIADVSHELKTPLAVMRLTADAISRKGDNGAGSDAVFLSEQILRMDRLVKNMLNLSALEMIKSVNRTPVDLAGVLGSLAEDYAVIADARDITIKSSVPSDFTVSGDADKLTRAFSNVLDNAVKYSYDGGTVEMHGAFSDGLAVVEVVNDGDGVPEEAADRVFEEFYRVEQSRASEYGGAGLGLAIVKRIVELHGGTISFNSSYKGPTRVKIILPVL